MITVYRLVFALATLGATAIASLSADERVMLFPTYARTDAATGGWVLDAHVWVFEPEDDSRVRQLAIEGLAKAVGVSSEGAQAETFRKRTLLFLADNERFKTVEVRVGEVSRKLDATSADGHSRGELRLTQAQLETALGAASELTVSYGGQRDRVHVIASDGVSVVSDIDDTIKVTNVLDRREMLANTFYREFHAVPGMASLYQSWAKDGAVFHYLSASPWQLYPALNEFLESSGFSAGPIHLRDLRLKHTRPVDLVAGGYAHKEATLARLFDEFPRRTFVLVGDTGERDPEIYGAIARRHPARVRRIFIRRVDRADNRDARFAKAFADLTRETWQLFDDPAELARYKPSAP